MLLIEAIDKARALLNEELDQTRSFPDNTSSFWKDSTLIKYYNMVQEEVQNMMVQSYEDYFVTQTFLNITDGCAGYQIPSGTIKIRRVEDARNTTPTEIRPVTINNKEVISSELGTAISIGGGYYLKGNQLVLTDTPAFTNASAIQVYYVKRLIDVTASDGVSEIPNEYHNVFVYGIYRLALIQEQADPTFATIEYEKQLNKIKTYCENRQVQRPRRVKSVYGDVQY